MGNEEFYILQVQVEELNIWTNEFDKTTQYITEAKLYPNGQVYYKSDISVEEAFHFNRNYLRILTMADSKFAEEITVYRGTLSYEKLNAITNTDNVMTGNIYGL